METYIRKPLDTAVFRDENGAVIDYGKRWGPAGPPQDSYSRISNVERFGPLQQVTENLVAYLLRNYDAERAGTDGHEFGHYQPRMPTKLLKLVPADPAASAITFVTSAEGTSLHCGVMFNDVFPGCSCDACDEGLEEAASAMERTVFAVVGGGLREAVDLREPLPVWAELRGADEIRGGNGRIEDLPAAWQDLAREMDREPFARHWAAWPERGSQR